ncbi:TRAP transporter small permease [Phaeovulum sp. W22_SRMD_FR3]|uniref:TRAP transporter small permease n=1 Tax=Phaeovulum sp. W22_SRMD_FR3 TaxID=3240274 RepID=UPI003F96B42F
MQKTLEKLLRWLATMLALVLVAMVVLICLGVALRYIWGVSLLWLDEALVFAMVGVVFLGAIAASYQDQHLRMTLLTQALPPPVLRMLRHLEHAATAGICYFVGWYSYQGVSRLEARGTLSNMAQIPLWIVQGTVLIGLLGMGTVALFRLVAGFRRRDITQ